jgi:PAS domain S-box-containing protein
MIGTRTYGALYTGLAILLAIFLGSLGIAALGLRQTEQRIVGEISDNLGFAMAQNEIELLRLVDTLQDYRVGEADKAAVDRRFALFWSRIALFEAGDMKARLERVPSAAAAVERAKLELRAIEPVVAGLEAGDWHAIMALRARLDSFYLPLRAATTDLFHAELIRLTSAAEARASALRESMIYFFGLLLSAVLLTLLLLGEVRRSRQLAATARQAESVAREHAERFADVVRVTSDWIWETDAEHRFIYVSEHILSLSGEDVNRLVGRTRWDRRLPDDRDDENWRRHRATLERHEAFRDFVFPYLDLKGRRRIARVTGEPRFSPDGSFLGYRGAGRDITGEIEAQREIAENRRLLRAIIDAVPANISLKDAQSRYLFMNAFQARMYGTTPEEAVGKTSATLVDPAYGSRSEELDQQVIASGRALRWHEREFLDPKGARHVWWAVKQPLYEEAGGAPKILSVALDITELKQVENARDNLSRYFSPNLVADLSRQDKPFDTVRRHDVAVLFLDIVDFTALAERRSPDDVFDLLRRYHSRMARTIFRHRGTLEKYLGDGLMATFGTPAPQADDARRALACVRDLLRTVDRWNERRQAAGYDPIRVSIGAHYGPVLLGNLGDRRRLEFAVVGDTVNVASRLEEMTRLLGARALVSGDLIEAAQRQGATEAELASFAEAPVQPVRGRGAPVTVRILQQESRAGVAETSAAT